MLLLRSYQRLKGGVREALVEDGARELLGAGRLQGAVERHLGGRFMGWRLECEGGWVVCGGMVANNPEEASRGFKRATMTTTS